MIDFIFILNSIMLGVGLAMDAFSVSLADGLHEPKMSKRRMAVVAGVYAAFQLAMPLIGWLFVSKLRSAFSVVQKFIPYVALGLLLFIGIKMIIEGFKEKNRGYDEDGEKPAAKMTAGILLLQGIATSIDALSVGLTISDKKLPEAALSAGIIGVVTFAICIAGIVIGKKTGEKLKWKASVLGGAVLIGVGIEIFVKNVFFM